MFRGIRNWLFLRYARRRFGPRLYSRIHAHVILYPNFDKVELLARAIICQMLDDLDGIMPECQCDRCHALKQIANLE